MKILNTLIIAALLCLLPVVSRAAGEAVQEDLREYRFVQGIVTGYSGTSLLVNEGLRVNLKYDTKFFDSQGESVGNYEVKEHKWIYVEGTVNADKSVDAQKIYLLPGRVENKDKKKYPFMQMP